MYIAHCLRQLKVNELAHTNAQAICSGHTLILYLLNYQLKYKGLTLTLLCWHSHYTLLSIGQPEGRKYSNNIPIQLSIDTSQLSSRHYIFIILIKRIFFKKNKN